jgi:acetyl-CoA C-acetyltransferase
MYAMCAPAYAKKYGLSDDQMRAVQARIAQKNHYNGARNSRAQFRREVSIETICNAPLMASGLGVYDCSGVADGSAAAVLVRAEDAHRFTDKPLYIKGLSFVAGNCAGNADPAYDYTWFPEIHQAAQDAYAQAGVTDPRGQIAMAEVHDCFTPPNSSSTKTSASRTAAPRGKRCSTVRSISPATSRSTLTEA